MLVVLVVLAWGLKKVSDIFFVFGGIDIMHLSDGKPCLGGGGAGGHWGSYISNFFFHPLLSFFSFFFLFLGLDGEVK